MTSALEALNKPSDWQVNQRNLKRKKFKPLTNPEKTIKPMLLLNLRI